MCSSTYIQQDKTEDVKDKIIPKFNRLPDYQAQQGTTHYNKSDKGETDSGPDILQPCPK